MSPRSSRTLNFRIVGRDMPGLVYGKSLGALVERRPVYVAIQKKTEAVDPVRGDAPEAVFNFPVEVTATPDDGLDFRGPFVHGERGDRFLYLTWGQLDPGGTFSMFRRAKLRLSEIRAIEIVKALSDPEPPLVEGTLTMTDDRGGPICGSAASKVLKWRVLTSD